MAPSPAYGHISLPPKQVPSDSDRLGRHLLRDFVALLLQGREPLSEDTELGDDRRNVVEVFIVVEEPELVFQRDLRNQAVDRATDRIASPPAAQVNLGRIRKTLQWIGREKEGLGAQIPVEPSEADLGVCALENFLIDDAGETTRLLFVKGLGKLGDPFRLAAVKVIDPNRGVDQDHER